MIINQFLPKMHLQARAPPHAVGEELAGDEGPGLLVLEGYRHEKQHSIFDWDGETTPNEKRRSHDLLSAVRTRLELATPGVTGRYSNQTELPHQWFGIAKVQLNFVSANFSINNFKKSPAVWAGLFFMAHLCRNGSAASRAKTGIIAPRSACGSSRLRPS